MSTVLVTGATAGFGRAIARRLVGDGHRVIATGRRGDRLEELARELGERLLPRPLDVTDPGAVAGFPDALPADWARVDVLVNNAGLARGMGPAQEAEIADWDRMVATNVTGLIHMTRAFLPAMVERGEGIVINLGSTAGDYPYPGGNVYGATKAFVRQFTLNLRADLVGTGVRATDIEPGLVGGSEFSVVRLGSEAAADKVYAGADALTPEDIAETVAWIVSLPPRVNVNRIELMPACQGPGPLVVKRRG